MSEAGITAQRDKLVYLFNTAHSVAMHNWSLKDFKPLCELQVKNDVLMGDNYQNHVGVTNFINSIAEVQRQDTMRCFAQVLLEFYEEILQSEIDTQHT